MDPRNLHEAHERLRKEHYGHLDRLRFLKRQRERLENEVRRVENAVLRSEAKLIDLEFSLENSADSG